MKRLPQKWTAILMLSGMAILASNQAHAGWVGPKLAGTWEITGTPDPDGCGPSEPFINLSTIAIDGTIVNVDPFLGSSVGEGYRLGWNSYAVGFFGFIPFGPNGPQRYEVQGTGKLINAGEIEGRFRTILSDLTGMNVGCIYEGTLTARRLVTLPF
jgi:hypothetical protein